MKAKHSSVKRILFFGIFVLSMLANELVLAGTVTYVYTDPQGTPLAEADQSGNVTATFEYKPYGSVYAAGGMSDAPDGPGYTGHVNDPDTGLVYMQARYYDPVAARFFSIDPVGIEAGKIATFARFAYASNNPVLNVDPTGMECTGSHITDSNGNCADSGKSTVNSGPATGGVVQNIKGAAIGAAQVAINKLGKVMGALGDSEAANQEPLEPADKYQARGAAAATVVLGAVSAVASDGESIELTADELLASANKDFNATGISNAARAWEKHAGRPNSTFDPLTGGIAHKNAVASEFVEEVLTNPGTVRTPLSRGGVQFRLPGGRGVRYNANGEFSGFLDPKRP